MTLVVDPPEGWRYGFPKAIPKGYMKMSWDDKKKWYIEQGYPKSEIDKYGELFVISMWDKEDEMSEQDLGHWEYYGSPFDPDDYFGFIYLITCTDPENPKRYIGRKQFHQYRKGKDRVVSNWKTYSSSSKHINTMVEELGSDKFKYEILQLFETKGGLSAGEVKVQWELDVLTEKYPDGTPVYLNRQIGAIKFIPKEEVNEETRERLSRIASGVREERKDKEGLTDSEEEGITTKEKSDKES